MIFGQRHSISSFLRMAYSGTPYGEGYVREAVIDIVVVTMEKGNEQ
jgi:hypothetical protein